MPDDKREQNIETFTLSDGTPVRLTLYDGKVVRVQVAVDAATRHDILEHFQDKQTGWKEAAPHYLLLQAIAGYEQTKLISDEHHHEPNQSEIDKVASLVKTICHSTAPLYELMQTDLSIKLSNLEKVELLKKQVEAFRDELNSNRLLVTDDQARDMAYLLRASSYALTNQFIAEIDKLIDNEQTPTDEQIKNLFSNREATNDSPTLGSFLRKQAHVLAGDSIRLVDDLVASRFDQLFWTGAHSLRKKLVQVKSDLAKLCSTHAARFLNTHAPVPKGQMEVLRGKREDSLSKERGLFDLTPYVKSMGEGIESLDDIDLILSYLSKEPLILGQGARKKLFIKPKSWFRKNLDGDNGKLALLYAGPAAILFAVLWLAGMLIAVAVDTVVLALRFVGLVMLGFIPLTLATVWDLTMGQLFSGVSLLERLSRFRPTQALDAIFQRFSLVRLFKQLSLNNHDAYELEDIVGKKAILDKIKDKQAEGLFSTVAEKYFSIAFVSAVLYGQIKNVFNGVREFFRVGALGIERFLAKNREEVGRQQRDDVFKRISNDNRILHEDLLEAFKNAFVFNKDQKKVRPIQSDEEKANNSSNTLYLSEWSSITPWKALEYTTPMDFISVIGLGLAHEIIDRAFEENPGIATPTFAAAMASLGALLLPQLIHLPQTQLVKVLQAIPQYIAKKFMGKTLVGDSMSADVISIFLQWKLLYFSLEGARATYHGDLTTLYQMFCNKPEQITLGALTLIAMGNGMGMFIPDLPPVHLGVAGHNFLAKAVNTYAKFFVNPVINGGIGILNWISKESREVREHGSIIAGQLEQAFIGLKSAAAVHMLMSGTHKVLITQLTSVQSTGLVEHLAKSGVFDNRIDAQDMPGVVAGILQKHQMLDLIDSEALIDAINEVNGLRSAEISSEVFDHIFKRKTTQDKQVEELSMLSARDHLKDRLKIIQEMEYLGGSVRVGNEDYEGYRSKADAEAIFDELSYAVDRYNVENPTTKIDATQLLHQFYNKHCYVGSSGLKKFLTLVFFPFTYPWRGIKYWIGTPSMRHQVKKSFYKEGAMFSQLLADILAPMMRSFLKSILYTVRMLLACALVYPVVSLSIAVVTTGVILGFATIASPFVASYAFVGAIVLEANFFSKTMGEFFNGVSEMISPIWNLFNEIVNPVMKLLSHIGGKHSILGSPHRADPLQRIGFTAGYGDLAATADTGSSDLSTLIQGVMDKVAVREGSQMGKLNNGGDFQEARAGNGEATGQAPVVIPLYKVPSVVPVEIPAPGNANG